MKQAGFFYGRKNLTRPTLKVYTERVSKVGFYVLRSTRFANIPLLKDVRYTFGTQE